MLSRLSETLTKRKRLRINQGAIETGAFYAESHERGKKDTFSLTIYLQKKGNKVELINHLKVRVIETVHDVPTKIQKFLSLK